MRARRGLLLSLTLFLLVTVASAQAADWPVPRGPSHEPVPYRFDPKKPMGVPKEFLDDAPACILYSSTSCLVEADGTVEQITHEVTRFNGRKGIEKLGEYRNIVYEPSYQALTLNEARVHKADGRVVPVEPRHVRLRDINVDYQIYGRDKQLVISFPGLEVGDAIEVKWTTRGKNPEFGGRCFGRYPFGHDEFPVALDELRVRLPKDMPFKHATVGGKVEPAVREEGNYRTYHWRDVNRPRPPQDEHLPSLEEFHVQVAWSTFASWDEVFRWKRQLRSECWECADEVRRVVREVTRELKSPEEKARALTYWVRRNVRYVSEGERHEFTPHTPGEVWANRYGDCKDQSQLLAVMLREAGVPVALATLGTLDDGQVAEAVPSPWGTHAILLVTLDGKDHWIDPTISLAPWDFLPRDDRDRLCYVVDDKDLRLVRTPVLTPEDNRFEQTTIMTVGADGSVRCVRTTVYHGEAALTARDNWMEVPPGERRRLAATELQDSQSKARLCRLEIDEAALRTFDQPVSARVTYELPGHFTGEAERDGSLSDSKVWGRLLVFSLDYDREAPLDLFAPFESRHRLTVVLPPAYRLDAVPKELELRSPWATFRVKVRHDPDEPRQVHVEFVTRLEKTRVEPADFEKFRRFYEDLNSHYRVWLTLRPATELEDAAALEAVLAFAPSDSASALVLARLYQQHGRPKDALRVLRRARHYRPGDAAVWELTAKVAEAAGEEEATLWEIVRRFPDEPKYAVSLGEALVNRGKYAEARTVLGLAARKGEGEVAAQAHYLMARSYLLQDQPEKALRQLEKAEEAAPEVVQTATALQMIGRLHEKLSERREAEEAYKQALLVDPEAMEALLALVRLKLAGRKPDEALDYLRRYTVAVAGEANGVATAAELHFRLDRFDDAFDLARRAQELKADPKALRVLGLVRLRRGEYAQAAADLEKAEPDSAVAGGLIQAYLALGRLRDAERQTERAAKAADPTPELRRSCDTVRELARRREKLRDEVKLPSGQESLLDSLLCANYAHEEGQPAERVESLLKAALAEGVEIGPAFGLRGLLALEKGRLTVALVDAERAIRLSPQDCRGYYVRGRVRLEREQEGALADLKRATELCQRKDARVLHWLAAALERSGRHDEALTTQREAVALRANDAELTQQLREFEKGRP